MKIYREKIIVEERPCKSNTTSQVSTKSVIKEWRIERNGENNFLSAYTKVNEGERQINESRAFKWMDGNIHFKEVNISNDDWPKMKWIGDY